MKSRCLCHSVWEKKHSSGATGHIPIFSYSGWGQYVLMMSWFSESLSSFASLSSNAFCTCQGRGPSCNRRLITAGEAKSRNGTQLLPAALNYFSTTGFPFPSFSVSLPVSAASLFVFDLSLFLSYSFPPHLPQSQYLPPPPPPIRLSIYFLISVSCSPSLCLPPFVLFGDLAESSGFGVSG